MIKPFPTRAISKPAHSAQVNLGKLSEQVDDAWMPCMGNLTFQMYTSEELCNCEQMFAMLFLLFFWGGLVGVGGFSDSVTFLDNESTEQVDKIM